MSWKNYSGMFTRIVPAAHEGDVHQCSVSIGLFHTGRQRVFMGYFCRLECNEVVLLNENSGSLYQAFLGVMREFIRLGYTVNLYGLQNSFRESGLSVDTGYGYVPELSSKAFLMIDQLPFQPVVNVCDDL